MKKNLHLLAFLLFAVFPVFGQTLYTSTTETGTRFSPGNGASGTPIVVFDDVLIPAAAVQGSDSITITKVNFGIRRLASAPAMTVNFYYTVVDDTSTTYNTFIKIPPVLIGTINLPAMGATAATSIISFGDSINTLFKVKTDTGFLYSGYQALFLGLSFTGADPGTLNGWRLTTPGSPQSDNDNAMWFYDVDGPEVRTARAFNGTTIATFYLEVFGKALTTVPVSLSDFTAQRTGKVNLINWSTGQEWNTSHFSVERSVDGKNYSALAKINATGNSSVTRHYSYTDPSPVKGINYYRLRIIDIDNNAKLSATRSVRNSGLADVAIYPNPVRDKLGIAINSDKAASGQLSITSAAGMMVYTRTVKVPKGSSRIEVPVEGIAAGSYVMKIQLDDDVIVKQFSRQ